MPSDNKKVTDESVEEPVAGFDEADEFEEFEQEDWTIRGHRASTDLSGAAPDATQWETKWDEAGWDEEDPDDSFQQRLKAEIEKAKAQK
ncbi:conserved hypothetical protein [Perkinsus marinus ATCC 50983]|uniref:Uncharacterized protein n=1 Tax=Perkinsus marinus (strain ATCC 50983 / TXsc) TaxID=423536 RepID=C5LHA3_PERM5|nr:conserved hypothetical protein [Perkinsus marinus ATCC 50983]EER03912.1 conserved hypothetical protein [Perkinsus marinus ATCC 50983]|eukprot:XP_002772096.1 conserved hypothetical protein [Perkinsus marinus ATCC 50983]